MSFPYTLVRDTAGRQYLTVYTGDGELPPVVADDHPHFETIREAAEGDSAGAVDIRELADLSEAVAAKFRKLSERVSVANGRVYFDGDELDDSISRHIIRSLDGELADWHPYVVFLENIAANPVEHSREQLFDWLQAHEFTIAQSGNIIAYKGVGENEDGSYSPTYGSGYAIVNGERRETITQRVGDVVELPRSSVVHDPANACSFGLHVGTYDYAQHYARNGALLKVEVNPRDVVSVPTHASGEKVRVCRYTVIEQISAPVSVPVESAEEEERCDCGSPLNEDGECVGLDEFCGEEEDEFDYCETCGSELELISGLCPNCDE